MQTATQTDIDQLGAPANAQHGQLVLQGPGNVRLLQGIAIGVVMGFGCFLLAIQGGVNVITTTHNQGINLRNRPRMLHANASGFATGQPHCQPNAEPRR
ncbi:hypothetical protein BMETH_495_1 [methanotrophic bacterial endosymbiont of Bathymodiolus sp.]|nr:hypothetical protein BMETH_495_1 [methanotrophic bacterial endosymbiont of Bathymodiolus sp.]